MKRRDFLKLSVAGAAGAAASCAALPAGGEPEGDRPNVLFIVADDLDYDEIGAFGNRTLTPNLDSIVAEGHNFGRSYVSSALCSPSRYSALTARYPSRCRFLAEAVPNDMTLNVINFFHSERGKPPVIEAGEFTLGHMFRGAGYRTAMVGKYHNDLRALLRNMGPTDSGAIDKNADPRDPVVNRLVRDRYEHIRDRIARNGGFDHVSRVYFDNKESMGLPNGLRFDNMPWVTEGALQFLEGNQDRPFFLYWSLPLPHRRIADGEEMGRRIKVNMVKGDLRATPRGWLDEPPSSVQPSREEVVWRVQERGYSPDSSLLTWMDDSIGAVLDKLEELGLAENTIVVFLSDHQSRSKRTNYELGVRAPMFIRWPGRIAPGSTSDRLVSNVDLMPTLAELCGISGPRRAGIDGRSAAPLLWGKGRPIHQSLLLEQGYSRAVVTENWKYITIRLPEDLGYERDSNEVYLDGMGWHKHAMRVGKQMHPDFFDWDQLYDLREDPEETNNLYGKPGYEEQTERMRELLREHLANQPFAYGEFTGD